MHEVILALGPTAGGGRTLIIQILLIAMILGITAWLFAKRGAKQLAVRRLIIIAFALFAVLTVIFPSLLTQVAHFIGVGRGTDLLLYATVIVLLGLIALQEARAKNEEARTTHLARRLSIDEAIQPLAVREQVFSAAPADAAPLDQQDADGPLQAPPL